jgi:hypothetical protein
VGPICNRSRADLGAIWTVGVHSKRIWTANVSYIPSCTVTISLPWCAAPESAMNRATGSHKPVFRVVLSMCYLPIACANKKTQLRVMLYAASRDMLVTVRGLPRVSYCARHTANKMMRAAFARKLLHAAYREEVIARGLARGSYCARPTASKLLGAAYREQVIVRGLPRVNSSRDHYLSVAFWA